MNIPLHEPEIGPLDETYVLDALRSTWVSTGGPYVTKFEQEFAKFIGCKHAVTMSSGTTAIQLAIEVLKRTRHISKGFEVLVPNISFVGTVNAVFAAGGHPILVDVSPGSLNMDPQQVSDILKSRYSYDYKEQNWISKSKDRPLLGILPVHVMGWACAIEEIKSIAESYGAAVIEDAAESLGSYVRESVHTGLIGEMGCFSFNGNKILTTGGGGMIVTNDDALACRAKHLSTTAKTNAERYVHDEIGYNYRMVNLLAAMGCSQLETLPNRLQRKERIFQIYREQLQRAGVKVYEQKESKPNHWLVNAIFDNELQRENALKNLNQKNVMARPLWTPFHRLPFIDMSDQFLSSFPRSDDIWRRCLSLPSSAHLGEESIVSICNEIGKSLRS